MFTTRIYIHLEFGSRYCNTNDLNDNPGIGQSLASCPSEARPLENIEIITSIQLLELNTTLQVINQCTLNMINQYPLSMNRKWKQHFI